MKALDGKKNLFRLTFGHLSLCLPLLFCAFFLCCLGLLRIGSFPLAASPPPPTRPLGRSLGPFGPVSFLLVPRFWVSGCILRRPVVMPGMECCEARLLSSLFLIATKASALCGALPSTPYCGCCSGAFLSCTEVFARATWGAISVDVCTFRRPKPIRGVEKAFRFWGGQGPQQPSLM